MDAMIVIGAAALGLASMRPGWVQFRAFWASIKMTPTWQAYAGIAQAGVTIALLNLAVTYVWLRLIPPRPPGLDLIRQPGMLFLVLLIGLSLPLLVLSAFVSLDAPTTRIFALALALSWYVACRRYRSRAEPGWVEGLGRCSGVGLIIAIAAT